MLREMTAADFIGWKNASSLGIVDLGGEAESQKQDIRTAQIVSTVMNILSRKTWKIDDVVLKWGRSSDGGPKKQKTNDELLMLMRQGAMMFMDAAQREQHFGVAA